MIRHPGYEAQVNVRPARYHEVVVIHHPLFTAVARELDEIIVHVDVYHVLGPAVNTGEHLPQGHGHGLGAYRRPDDLGKERLEDHVVLAVEQDYIGLFPRELAAKGLGAFHARESPADYKNLFPDHLFTLPTFRI